MKTWSECEARGGKPSSPAIPDGDRETRAHGTEERACR